jgi:hypothetical protein
MSEELEKITTYFLAGIAGAPTEIRTSYYQVQARNEGKQYYVRKINACIRGQSSTSVHYQLRAATRPQESTCDPFLPPIQHATFQAVIHDTNPLICWSQVDCKHGMPEDNHWQDVHSYNLERSSVCR